MRTRFRRGVPPELVVVWALVLFVAAEIFVTYSRLPADDLYHVSGTGPDAAVGRVLVFLNYPVALIALPIILLALDRVAGLTVRTAGIAGLLLCSVVFWPGVVDQADLDAKAVNALPALGVAVAVALTIALARSRGVDPPIPVFRATGDRLRIGVTALALVAAVPWMLADLGLSLDGVPVLGSIWQTGELRSQPGVWALHPAVHHGHHHGMDGVLFVVTAFLLSRRIPAIDGARIRNATAAFLSLMLAYGVAEIANDFWLEQVVKRGWTDWEIPDVTRPSLSVGWGVIVLAAIAIYSLWFGRSERRPIDSHMPVPETP